jgi:hypothetical protein
LPPLDWPEQIVAGLRSIGVYITLIPVGVTLIAGYILSRRVDIKNSVLLKDLKGSDIVQINATVIAGVLIFLTIWNLFIQHEIRGYSLMLLTATIIYPFAISSIRTISKGSLELGVKMMIAGFIYLMVAVVLLPFI